MWEGRGKVLRAWERLTHRLEVEGDHLAAGIPEHLGQVVGGVHAGALGVDAAHLAFVVAAPEYRSPLRLHQECPAAPLRALPPTLHPNQSLWLLRPQGYSTNCTAALESRS